ncbi:MAG: S8 family serine peptidase, partial [Acidobacteria bacterium]|nr:S8 family serine peptidase [Acidobacteriota bacterium]
RAAAGRALESSRTLAALPRVLWAEPNFARIVLETPAEVPPLALVPPGPAAPMFFLPPRALEAPPGWRQMAHWERPRQLGDWYVLVDGHFEDDAPGWSQAHAAGAPRVEPGVTEYRARGGRRSVYMTQSELDGKRAPGPYAGGADAFLLSPVFALAGYADAYIELWFWARFEDAAGDPPVARDFARVRLLDGISGRFVLDRPIAPVEWSGDIALGAPGELGWRRLVFQVPPELMGPALVLVVEFVSDPADAAEGLYLDDIRVLARERGFALRTPTDPLAGREWFLAPGQQVASHPAPAENVPGAAAAWKHGHVADELVLALLDDGVERGHPDLAFWVPDDGVPLADPGEPAEPGDRHGTACAGIAAALADNAAGVAGVAQGTLLFPLRRGLDDAAIAASVDEAARRGARVLAFPWGWRETPAQVVADAISDAVARGVIVVAAAGDRPAGAADDPGVDFPCSLAATTPLVCVGAASPAGEPKGAASADGQYWWRSAAGATVIAPGTWLATTDRRGPLGYNDGSGGVPADWTATFGGSGAATCHVAGLAALMLSRDPELEPVRLGQMLRASAIPALPGAPGIVAPEPAVAAAVQSANARRESTR